MDNSHIFDELFEASLLDQNPPASFDTTSKANSEGLQQNIQQTSKDKSNMHLFTSPQYPPPSSPFPSHLDPPNWTNNFLTTNPNTSFFDWNNHVQNPVSPTTSFSPSKSTHHNVLDRLHKNYNINLLQLDVCAHSYVQNNNELIIPNTSSSISPSVEYCLACLLGCVTTTNSYKLPPAIYNFFLCINCVSPFQMINKLGGN